MQISCVSPFAEVSRRMPTLVSLSLSDSAVTVRSFPVLDTENQSPPFMMEKSHSYGIDIVTGILTEDPAA